MGLVSAAQGSQPAAIDTEHSLTQQTGIGIYVLVVDTSALQAGDIVEIRIKTKCVASGTVKVAYVNTFSDEQVDPHKYTVPVPVDSQIACTVKQTAGTGRTFPWNLLRA